MTESIGTARLDVVVGTEGVDAGVGKITAATRDMSKAAKDASASMEQNSKRQVAALERQIATLGKSKEELIAWRIEQQTSGRVSADLAAKLEAQVKHLQSSGKALNAYGQSAKQTAAALRGVPAQVTDIVTGIASGQRPLTILLQQGGQLKDMFGGVVPAARALGGAILGLVNPYTIAAAAIVGLGVAVSKAEGQMEDFNKVLVLSGNTAKLTASQLRDMAKLLDGSTTATAGKAAEVLAQVTASGRFTAEQIQMVAKAAIEMEDATGQAIEQTIQQFVGLSQDPVSAILKLNETQNFLTEATIKQIEEFQKQGREADAAALAIKAYADTIDQRVPELTQHLSASTAVWRDIKRSVGEAGDAVVQFFGDASSAVDGFLRRHQQAVSTIASTLSKVPIPLFMAQGDLLGSVTANAGRGGQTTATPVSGFNFATASGGRTVDSRDERNRIDAEKEFGQIVESHLSKQKKLEEEIAHIREIGKKAGVDAATIEQQVSAARAAAAEKATRTGGDGRVRTPRVTTLPDFGKDAANDLLKQAEAEDRATQSFLDMQAALDGPLAQAEREHAKRVAELNKLAGESPAAAAGLANALEKEAQAHQKNVQAIQAELDPLGQLLQDMQFELDTIGLSNTQRAVMIELRRNHIDVMSQEAQAALATASAFDAEAKAKQTSIDLMDDFRRGASSALSDFVTGAKSAKDALTDFFDSLAEQITKAISDQWIQKLFGQEGSSGSGTSGGGWLSSILGALFGGGGGEQIYAKGGAFEGGVQKFAYGGVVSSPTNFGMAGGRLGLMGEAGPEAILPLHRGPDGKLGVRMEASNGSARSGPTVVNQTVVVQGRIDSRTPAQFAQATGREQNRASARNR
jgi:lambda family phage tail tape measure protein